MRLSGLQKLTLLDYPGHTAATVFTPGCTFRCPFCHNAGLVVGDEGVAVPDFPEYPIEDFWAFLDKRRGLLDGVCVTGGEPTLQNDLDGFCAHLHELGFKVKLDTNGSLPNRLKALVEYGLVDFVAMDIKNSPEHYAGTVGLPGLDMSPIRESVDFLKTGVVPYEFRTTVVRELHTAEDLREVAAWLSSADVWYLQAFRDSDTVIAGEGSLHAYTPAEMRTLLNGVLPLMPRAQLRGV